MSVIAAKSTKTVGAYEAKTHLPRLLDMVERGRTVTITRRAKTVARIVPVGGVVAKESVFERLEAMRDRLKGSRGVTAKELVNQGRRI